MFLLLIPSATLKCLRPSLWTIRSAMSMDPRGARPQSPWGRNGSALGVINPPATEEIHGQLHTHNREKRGSPSPTWRGQSAEQQPPRAAAPDRHSAAASSSSSSVVGDSSIRPDVPVKKRTLEIFPRKKETKRIRGRYAIVFSLSLVRDCPSAPVFVCLFPAIVLCLRFFCNEDPPSSGIERIQRRDFLPSGRTQIRDRPSGPSGRKGNVSWWDRSREHFQRVASHTDTGTVGRPINTFLAPTTKGVSRSLKHSFTRAGKKGNKAAGNRSFRR